MLELVWYRSKITVNVIQLWHLRLVRQSKLVLIFGISMVSNSFVVLYLVTVTVVLKRTNKIVVCYQ